MTLTLILTLASTLILTLVLTLILNTDSFNSIKIWMEIFKVEFNFDFNVMTVSVARATPWAHDLRKIITERFAMIQVLSFGSILVKWFFCFQYRNLLPIFWIFFLMKKRLNSTVARHGWTRPKINWSKQHPNLACLAFPKCSESQIQKVRNLGRLRIEQDCWRIFWSNPGGLQNPKFRNWNLESEVQIWRYSLWMTAGFWGKFSLQPIPWRIVFGWQAYGAQWSFELFNSQIVELQYGRQNHNFA